MSTRVWVWDLEYNTDGSPVAVFVTTADSTCQKFNPEIVGLIDEPSNDILDYHKKLHLREIRDE